MDFIRRRFKNHFTKKKLYENEWLYFCIGTRGGGIEGDANKVIIIGGIVGGAVTGGLSAQRGSKNNGVCFSGGKVSGDIMGGYTGRNSSSLSKFDEKANRVTLNGRIAEKSMIGRLASFANASSNKVTISSNSSSGEVIGSKSENGSASVNNITIEEATIQYA